MLWPGATQILLVALILTLCFSHRLPELSDTIRSWLDESGLDRNRSVREGRYSRTLTIREVAVLLAFFLGCLVVGYTAAIK